MQHVQQLNSLTGQHPALTPLRVTTIQPARHVLSQALLKDVSLRERLIELLLAISTFSLGGSLLLGLYRALGHYTIIPLP